MYLGDLAVYETHDVRQRDVTWEVYRGGSIIGERTANIFSRWGDRVTLGEKITFANGQTSISSWIVNQLTSDRIDLFASLADSSVPPHNAVVTNSFGGPSIKLTGNLSFFDDLSFPSDPSGAVLFHNRISPHLFVYSINEILGSKTNTTRITRRLLPDELQRIVGTQESRADLMKIEHPDGLSETILYSGSGVFKGGEWFVNGKWMPSIASMSPPPPDDHWVGFRPQIYAPYSSPSASPLFLYSDRACGVIFEGGDLVGKAYLFPKILPAVSILGGDANNLAELKPYIFTEPKHITYVLEYPTAQVDPTSSFRGYKFVHASGANWENRQGKDPYLFYSAAILQEQEIYGTGAPENIFDPLARARNFVGWEPNVTLTDRVTTYSNWELKCFLNPTGDPLFQAVNAVPTLTQTVVGDPNAPRLPMVNSVVTARDSWGPSEWKQFLSTPGSGRDIMQPRLAGIVDPATDIHWAGSNPVNVTGDVAETRTTTRHFDATLGKLLEDSSTVSLSGSALPSLREGVTTDGLEVKKAVVEQRDALGRPLVIRNIHGVYESTETRVYSGTNPEPDEVTHALSGPELTAPTFSGRTGKKYTYGPAPHHWLLGEEDKLTGQVTTYERDGRGRVTKSTDLASGVVTTFAYDELGRITESRKMPKSGSALGQVVTSFVYDINNRWKEEKVQTLDFPSGGSTLTTRTELDAFGQVIKVIKPDGSYQTTAYNGWGQVRARSPWLKPGQTPYGDFSFEYDALKGRLTAEKDPQGRLLKRYPSEPSWGTLNADGASLTGVLSTVVNDRGGSITEVRDLLGQRGALVDELGHVTRFAYDRRGMLARTDNAGQQRKYQYNDMGWLMSKTEPEEGLTLYSDFTALGYARRTQMKGRDGNGTGTLETTLDDMHRPSRIVTRRDGAVQTDRAVGPYRVDFPTLAAQITETQPYGQLKEVYGYDGFGRMTSKSISDGKQTFSLLRTLDVLGNPLKLEYPAAGGRGTQTQTWDYDAFLRPKQTRLDGQLRAMMTYDQVSGTRVTDTILFGNGVSTQSVTNLGELEKTIHATQAGPVLPTGLEEHAVSWTAGGLMTRRGGDVFEYDPLGRLTYALTKGPAGESVEQWFGFDRWGNRVRSDYAYSTPQGGPAKPQELLAWDAGIIDPVNNFLPGTVQSVVPGTWRGGLGTSQINGNLAVGAIYDNWGRVGSLNAVPGDPSTATSWIYDPAGRVLGETVNGQASHFLLDVEGLRFKRMKTGGETEYTIYGFNREPLMVLGQAASESPTMAVQSDSRKTSSLRKGPAALRERLTLRRGRTVGVGKGGGGRQMAIIAPDDGGEGGGGGGGGTTTLPAGATITQPAAPPTVGVGQVVSFAGSTTYGTSLSWLFGDGASAVGATASHAFASPGSYTVTFKASATGYTTTTATQTVTVVAKPTISSFTASPSSLVSGQSSTLSWSVSGATSLSLSSVGGVTGTSQSVTPATTTTYTLTATNAAGSTTATVTVAVSAPPPPTVSGFSAAPSRIGLGQGTTLQWSASGATTVSISGLGAVTGSSVVVTPSTTTTYTLTASNASGTASASVTVEVVTQMPVITSFMAMPHTLAPGGTTQLQWVVNLADSLNLSSVGPVTGTSLTVSPATTQAYVLTATNPMGSVQATVQVTVQSAGALQWQKTLVYGFGQHLAEEQPGLTTRFIQGDQVGSPNLITDAAGQVVGRTKNLPFGERLEQQGEKSFWRYTNHEDQEGSAIYMQARTYLPVFGRFAQVDPLYDQKIYSKDSWNLYGYVTNNPVTQTDSTGQSANPYSQGFYWGPGYVGDGDNASGGRTGDLLREHLEKFFNYRQKQNLPREAQEERNLPRRDGFEMPGDKGSLADLTFDRMDYYSSGGVTPDGKKSWTSKLMNSLKEGVGTDGVKAISQGEDDKGVRHAFGFIDFRISITGVKLELGLLKTMAPFSEKSGPGRVTATALSGGVQFGLVPNVTRNQNGQREVEYLPALKASLDLFKFGVGRLLSTGRVLQGVAGGTAGGGISKEGGGAKLGVGVEYVDPNYFGRNK